MKKINVFLGILVGLLFFSCGTNDDDIINTSIIGSWSLINQDGSFSVACSKALTITREQITQNEFTGTNCSDLESSTDDYTYDGRTFTIQTDTGDLTFTVITINSSVLQWETIDPETNNTINLIYNRIL